MGARLVWRGGALAGRRAALKSAQVALDQAVMQRMEPYMQRVSGRMIASMGGATAPGGGRVVVAAPYARRVYYARTGVGRASGPLRGPRYFDRMKADHAGALLALARAALGVKG